MTKAKSTTTEKMREDARALHLELSEGASYKTYPLWIVGDTPLIEHAWSQKAKKLILDKQLKTYKGKGREQRDPDADFLASLYHMEGGGFGFPVTGIKNSWIAAAHKDRGVPKTAVMAGVFVHGVMSPVKTAYEKAICDLPLVKVFGGDPQMREDMVNIGSGVARKTDFSYRGQFFPWAIKLRVKVNVGLVTQTQFAFLIRDAGVSVGIGDWRNEKKGVFGSYHLAGIDEMKAWEDFAAGKTKTPPVPRVEEDEELEKDAAE